MLFVGTSTELFNHPAGAMLGLFHMTLGEFQVVLIINVRCQYATALICILVCVGSL